MSRGDDARVMRAAIALSQRVRGLAAPNPNVGCIVTDARGVIVGRGVTQRGGRPHAEAMALAQAADRARGGTAYVTLEPCFHLSPRGPRCADVLARAGLARVVIALVDPDPRTCGQSIGWLRDQGLAVDSGILEGEARAAMAGFFIRQTLGRPFITLKLATSLDGAIALADGSSRWITGARARAHAHLERARHEGIAVGQRTFATDAPRLDVRLAGLEDRAPRRFVLTHGAAPEGWERLAAPQAVAELAGVESLLVEGGAETAAAFLRAGLVDRLLLYRAPILLGGSARAALGDIGLADLAAAHGQWRLADSRMLGEDRMEVYLRPSSA